MDSLFYILCLLAALVCLALVDFRYKLVFYAHARQAALFVGAGVLFFIAWDLCGIGLGIFEIGSGTRYMTGLLLAPELPVEEPLLLATIVYQTLIAWELVRRQRAR